MLFTLLRRLQKTTESKEEDYDFYENLMYIIDTLANDKQIRYEMSKKAKSKIDGNGAKRTIKELIG